MGLLLREGSLERGRRTGGKSEGEGRIGQQRGGKGGKGRRLLSVSPVMYQASFFGS